MNSTYLARTIRRNYGPYRIHRVGPPVLVRRRLPNRAWRRDVTVFVSRTAGREEPAREAKAGWLARLRAWARSTLDGARSYLDAVRSGGLRGLSGTAS